MLISKQKMQLIVEEMEKTIHKPINIMDREGCIIASTDISRVGSFHSGAQDLIQHRMNHLMISDDADYKESKNGISLPLMINNDLVGVVGVTGPQEEVEVFGSIIKKMAELLIYDAYQTEQQQQRANAKNTFIYQWLFDPAFPSDDEQTFQFNAQLLGIDTTIPRVIVLMQLREVSDAPIPYDSPYCRQFKKILKSDFPAKKGHVHIRLNNRFILLCAETNQEMLGWQLGTLKNKAEKQFPLALSIGIGTTSDTPQGVQRSYKEAERACQFSLKTRDAQIRWYQEADLILFLQDIPDYRQISFVHKLFPDCDTACIASWMKMLHYFFEYNGSITKTAASLYVHKNTLQYRLTKLRNLTGYDPRILNEAMPLYIAMIIYENNKLFSIDNN